MDTKRYHPLSKPILSLAYTGARFEGLAPEPFRLLCQVQDQSPLLGPFWAGQQTQLICQTRLMKPVDEVTLRMGIEPNGDAFSLGGSIHELKIPLWCAEYPASGTASSAPIRLRTTESPVLQSQEISVQFDFRWHLHSPIEDVLALVMDYASTRSGMYGIRVLARRISDAQHAMHPPRKVADHFSADDNRRLNAALCQLYFAYLMRRGGPWDVRLGLRTQFGGLCLDRAQGLLYAPEAWNAFIYGYMGASAGFSEEAVMAVPDLSEAFRQLETIGLRDITDRYLQEPGEGWQDLLMERHHLCAELLRIGHVLDREGIEPRADLAIPNALVLGYDLGKSLNGRKMPSMGMVLSLVREAGFPATPFKA